MKKHKVTLRPTLNVVEIDTEVNLLEALKKENIYIKSSCGGHATCSDCIVKVCSGEDYLSPPTFLELKLLGNVFHITKERLACQTCIEGDVTIDIEKHDLVTDEMKLKQKTSNFSKKKVPTKIRKEESIQQLKNEKIKNYEALDLERNKKEESWMKHWEKSDSTSQNLAPKKLAGGKRPKFFDTDKAVLEEPKKVNKFKKNDSEIKKSDKVFKKFRE